MTREYSEEGMDPWPVQVANANRRANAAVRELDAARDAERAATEAWKRLLGDEAKARAERDAALARVKELESERDDALRDEDIARALLGNTQAELDAANADRARLRGVLEQVRTAMAASDQGPDGDNDPRRPLASAVWAALASTDASQWLRERERRVAERVFAKCVGVAVSTGPCKEHRHQCELDQTVDAITDALKAIDLAALLKEET